MSRTRWIPPFVMLAAMAVVAVVTYLRDFSFDEWLLLLFSVMVLFLFVGEVLRLMIEYFIRSNEARQAEAEDEAEGWEEEETEEGEEEAEQDLVSDLPPVE